MEEYKKEDCPCGFPAFHVTALKANRPEHNAFERVLGLVCLNCKRKHVFKLDPESGMMIAHLIPDGILTIGKVP